MTVLDPGAVAEARGATPPPPPEAALEGDLASFGVADVLQFLRLAGATGRLECRRGGDRVAVAFAHGRPVWASNSGPAVRVGDVLVHRGWTAAAALEAAIAAQATQPARRVGALLRERGVAAAHVAAAVGEVFRRLVCLLSLWPDGRFRFVPDAVDGDDDVALDAELDRLLLEGLVQADLAAALAPDPAADVTRNGA